MGSQPVLGVLTVAHDRDCLLGLYGQAAAASNSDQSPALLPRVTGNDPDRRYTTHNLDQAITWRAACATVAINTASYSLATYPKVYANLITQERRCLPTADLTARSRSTLP